MQDIQRIPLEGACNTRDLGGLRTMDGRAIRPCRLIRSGRLGNLTEEDRRILLEEYKVQTVVDFRLEFEQEEVPDPELDNVTFLSHPVLDARLMGVLHLENVDILRTNQSFIHAMRSGQLNHHKFFSAYYEGLITSPHSIAQYVNFFDVLLKQKTGSVLWHCHSGKDRTGIATMLLLSALGVSQEDILHDYMVSNVFLEPEMRRHRMQSGEDMANKPVRAVEEDYYMSAMDTIYKYFGNMGQYLENYIKVTPERVLQLRGMYLW